MRQQHLQFPFDLDERKRLFQQVIPLMDLLFQQPPQTSIPPWVPRQVITSSECPQLPIEAGARQWVEKAQFSLIDVLLEYNLRIAEISRLLEPLEDVLFLAGLSEQDLDAWRKHRQLARQAISRPDGVTVAQAGMWYIYTTGASVWSIDITPPPPEVDRQNQGRRTSCAEALSRLRRATTRIERTVNPQAVLERLKVAEDKKIAILDETTYGPLRPNSEGRYLYYLRLGLGDWVSSNHIAKRENLSQFKVDLPREYLEKRHPQLGAIIDSKDGHGSRIVLPLLPAWRLNL